VTLAASIVLAIVVRSPLELPWVVTAWVIGMSGAGILIAAGMLYLVVVDVVRAGRAARPPRESVVEEESGLEEDTVDGLVDDGEPAGQDPAAPPSEVYLPGSHTGLGPVVPIPPESRPGPPPPPSPQPAERLTGTPHRI